MTGLRCSVVTICLLVMGAAANGEELSPREIFDKVRDVYANLETYYAEGVITSNIDTDAMKIEMNTSFSILLKKPNQYLVSWTQKGMPIPGMEQSGAVWSDGTQPYLYMGIMKAYSKMENDEMALASATGISGGVAHTIPSMFLSVFTESNDPFSRLADPVVGKTELIGDEDCYVLSGASAFSKKESYWISKNSFLIQKYNRSLEIPEGGMEIPEMTDEQLDEAILALGEEVSEETRRSVKEMMKKSTSLVASMKLKGLSSESHTNISSPNVGANDFEFDVPDGTVLKDSLFGDVLGAFGNLPE